MAALTGLIQESLIALLLYDKQTGGKVRSIVPVRAFDNPYRRFAEKAYTFWDQFSEPPGEHALDICAEIESDFPKDAEVAKRLFDSIQECREGINAKYVLDKAGQFIRNQGLRTSIVQAVEMLEEDKTDEAEQTLRKALKGGLDLFEPGLIFSKLSIINLVSEDVEAFPTGIRELDEKKLGPAVGEQHLLIAPTNYGKSWYLLQLAKSGMMARKRAVYITLEMSEKKVASRLLQSFYGLSKRPETRISHTVFEENDLGQFCGLGTEELDGVQSLSEIAENPKLAKRLQKKHKGFLRRSPIIIKQFPTGSLTTAQLIGYLEALEAQQGIVPHLLLVDYPDLMYLGDRQEHRIGLGRLFQELRGIAVDRNLAVAVVSQTNRQAVGKRWITEKDVAEDYSKIATCDTAISYNQSEEERKLGLARLYVMKARNEEKGMSVLLSQNYSIGQFCISSMRMSSGYWRSLKEQETREPEPREPRDRTRKRLRL